MATLSELQERLETLRKRRESLVTRVTNGETTVQYDLTQTNEAIADLQKQITEAGGGKKLQRYRVRGAAGRGWT